MSAIRPAATSFQAEALDREHAAYVQRLITCHGLERARAILAGNDPETQADLAKWNGLGKTHAVAR